MFLCVVLFTIRILTSYNNHIGNATSDSVKTSEVGVIMTATTRMTTMACLRYLRRKSAERNPNLANSHEMRTQFLKIVTEYTLTVHTATVAGDARRDLALGAIETVHLVSGFFYSLDELPGQMVGIPVPARTSCQYYYFHFLIRFIIQQFGGFAIPTPESRVAPAAAPTVFMNFLLSISVQLFSFNHFDRWSATSDIIQVRQQEMRVTHSSVPAN